MLPQQHQHVYHLVYFIGCKIQQHCLIIGGDILQFVLHDCTYTTHDVISGLSCIIGNLEFLWSKKDITSRKTTFYSTLKGFQMSEFMKRLIFRVIDTFNLVAPRSDTQKYKQFKGSHDLHRMKGKLTGSFTVKKGQTFTNKQKLNSSLYFVSFYLLLKPTGQVPTGQVPTNQISAQKYAYFNLIIGEQGGIVL